jgi:hypothetical protein
MTTLSVEQQAMVALFQRHVEAELAGDLAATMATMTDDPHLNHVPTMRWSASACVMFGLKCISLVSGFCQPLKRCSLLGCHHCLGDGQAFHHVFQNIAT